MALQSSGLIRLSQVQTEFGGSDPINLTEYYRNGVYVTSNNTSVPTTGKIDLSDFYGTVRQFSFSITSNTQNANLNTLALSAGWDGSAPLIATVNSGVYLWSDDTALAGLLLNVSNATVINNGYIIGRGGDGATSQGASGQAGGPAISVTASGATVSNTSGAYIAGGGGGGGSAYRFNGQWSGGGGGAGGGTGGATAVYTSSRAAGGAVGQEGADGLGQANSGGGAGGASAYDDESSSGSSYGAAAGGGGRILPGVGGTSSGGRLSTYGDGGSADGVGENGAVAGNGNRGGGGGGWGAAGGSQSSRVGGAGGAAITGTAVSLTDNGTIYGST